MILMKKQCFWNLDKCYFLTTFWKYFFIENVGVLPETQYDLQQLSINVSKENKHQILDSLGRRKNHFIIEHIKNLMLLIKKIK